MKIKMAAMATIPALILAIAGYAEEPSANPKTQPSAEGEIEVGAITAISKVTAVDPAKRMVTLTNADGVTNTYKLGKKVRTLTRSKSATTSRPQCWNPWRSM
jgi:predicted Zn-dependent protease